MFNSLNEVHYRVSMEVTGWSKNLDKDLMRVASRDVSLKDICVYFGRKESNVTRRIRHNIYIKFLKGEDSLKHLCDKYHVDISEMKTHILRKRRNVTCNEVRISFNEDTDTH
jgi:hypothetical protein